MREEIERLLPRIKNSEISDAEIQILIERIKNSIRDDVSKGKELGELLAFIKQAHKNKSLFHKTNWVQAGKGFLAIGHKPGGKISFEGLQMNGTTVVLTLLNENEGSATIGIKVQQVNIRWLWFPFSASTSNNEQDIDGVRALLEQLKELLQAGNKIYIHCSAGIHRTGMITMALLQYMGNEKDTAFKILQLLREVTAAQVGEERLSWANQFSTPDR